MIRGTITTMRWLAFVATVIHAGFSTYNGGRAYREDFTLTLILIWALKFILCARFDKNSEASLIELKPITGRKHQLRKQLYAIGQPIFGDIKYRLSNSNKGINKNLMLHSYQIRFKIDNVKHTYTALLPEYFKKLLKVKRLNFSSLK